MQTFLDITLYSSLVLGGLSALALALVLLGKFLTDNTHDPESEH